MDEENKDDRLQEAKTSTASAWLEDGAASSGFPLYDEDVVEIDLGLLPHISAEAVNESSMEVWPPTQPELFQFCFETLQTSTKLFVMLSVDVMLSVRAASRHMVQPEAFVSLMIRDAKPGKV